jgi:hypothetical protein
LFRIRARGDPRNHQYPVSRELAATGQRAAERLVAAGYTSEEAFTLLGCALSREMYEVLGSKQSFDEMRYIANLERLPALPWV